ncbi:putative bifunctional diguanylate cyclase/phosphodiesterase [Kineobactrum salinum]|uniref:Bifunctional diguanylate cyclase/phosphodiesterase n=1 Tax=Kineobactrum salinum TaxID=2708301 RepID=A0A6C0U1U7_9GAMM|nr:bifunctional diguanylate cyclase/phosphodiesterase [Kineobactrum salinum]QIB66021.1 bifunctional diguanylate cyclase/phosphodiesterase [Kineobactrum salinum]
MSDVLHLVPRGEFLEVLGGAVDHAREGEEHLGLLLVDLGNLAAINHRHGYDIGDGLLREAGSQLLAVGKLPDTVFRISSHTFAFLLRQLNNPAFIALAVNRIQRLLDESLYIDADMLPVAVKIGLTVNRAGRQPAHAMLMSAEASLSQVKRGRALQIDELIAEEAPRQRNLVLEQQFSQALYDNDFELYFQPKIDLRSGQVCGAEALLRWSLQGYGSVPPEQIVQMAETSGQGYELAHWVVNRALRYLREWRGSWELPLAVNIQAGLVNHPDLANMIQGALAIWGASPAMLAVEITEDAIIEDKEAGFSCLKQLRALGLQLSIDDFGTGYSSLSYFRHIPATELKIDKSFISRLLGDEQERALVRIIVDIAHLFGLTVVAEGVEDSATLEALRVLDCDVVQGYFFARPLPPQELLDWYAKRRGAALDDTRS